jgi:hypothetical protein
MGLSLADLDYRVGLEEITGTRLVGCIRDREGCPMTKFCPMFDEGLTVRYNGMLTWSSSWHAASSEKREKRMSDLSELHFKAVSISEKCPLRKIINMHKYE